MDSTSPSHWRPRTRADCAEVPRPCPYVGCRHNLALEVRGDSESIHRAGVRSLSLRASAARVEEWSDAAVLALSHMEETCSIDVSEGGPVSLDKVGEILGISRERVRQIDKFARARLKVRLGK